MNRLSLLFFLCSIATFSWAQTCVRGNCKQGFGTLEFPNKNRYVGEFADGIMTGRGIYYFANGNKYIGYWSNNKKHGEGKLVYANGNVYSGKFNQDRITGLGSMVYKSGDKYVGHWKNEQPSGNGTFYYATGERYEGEFLNGKYEGKGKLYYSNGSYYEGEWKDDLKHGYGAYVDIKGTSVEGQWEKDKPIKVIETSLEELANGYEMDPQTNELKARPNEIKKDTIIQTPKEEPIVQNKIEEKQRYKVDTKILISMDSDEEDFMQQTSTTDNAPKQETKLNNNQEPKPHEKPKINTKIDNNPYEKPKIESNTEIQSPTSKLQSNNNSSSEINNHKLNNSDIISMDEKLPNCNNTYCKSGRGIMDYADGSKFIGEFINGEPRGKGVCYYANGDRYDGMWINHAPHGEGVMYFKSGLVYGAIWEHGIAKSQITTKQEYQFNPNVKVDRSEEVKIWAVVVGVSRYVHMPALKYSDDDAYKIYAFLKSPEGGAIPDEQIALLIDEDATRNNILKSLNEVSLKADENDVVMVYFSGHGLEGTFIPIDYDGYQNALRHDDVREMLNKSLAKHKVCYADACHSGSLLAAKSPFASDLNFFYEELDKTKGGTAFMMSSKSKEYSLEDGGLRQGIFSHYLIRGLKGEADINKNKTITIRELFDFVSKNVKDYSGSAQSPVIAGDYDELMPVGFVRGRK